MKVAFSQGYNYNNIHSKSDMIEKVEFGTSCSSLPICSPIYFTSDFHSKNSHSGISFKGDSMQDNEVGTPYVDDDILLTIMDNNGCIDCGNMNFVGSSSRYFPGFKTLIRLDDTNLSEYGGLSSNNECATVNFNLNNYGFSLDFWNSPVFLANGADENDLSDNVDDKSREFIDNFTTVIHHLNEGRCYMSSDMVFHEERMLLFDSYFNPKSTLDSKKLLMDNAMEGHFIPLLAIKMKNLYDKLTSEDKAKMGWDDEFDKNFLPRLIEDVSSFGEDVAQDFKLRMSK